MDFPKVGIQGLRIYQSGSEILRVVSKRCSTGSEIRSCDQTVHHGEIPFRSRGTCIRTLFFFLDLFSILARTHPSYTRNIYSFLPSFLQQIEEGKHQRRKRSCFVFFDNLFVRPLRISFSHSHSLLIFTSKIQAKTLTTTIINSFSCLCFVCKSLKRIQISFCFRFLIF